MKTIILLVAFICLVFLLLGCNEPPIIPDGPGAYVSEFVQSLPEGCGNVGNDDYCAAFECTVNLCYCDYVNYSNPVLKSGEGNIVVENEMAAFFIVQNYFENPPIVESGEIPHIEYVNSVKINDSFYNVFYTINGMEDNATVSIDGAIIRTVCGV